MSAEDPKKKPYNQKKRKTSLTITEQDEVKELDNKPKKIAKPKPKKVGYKKKTGFKGKLSARLQRRMCNLIKIGSWPEIAAAACGIRKSTLEKWLIRGNRAIEEKNKDHTERMYARFVMAVNRAVAEAELLDIERIDEAAKNGVWQAAAWKLSHGMAKERYGEFKKLEHEHSGKGGGPISHQSMVVDLDVLSLPLEVRKQIISAMREKNLGLPAPKEEVKREIIDAVVVDKDDDDYIESLDEEE